MLDEGDRVLLLLSGSVDVGKEEWYVVVADQRHNSHLVEFAVIGLARLLMGRDVTLLVVINDVVWEFWGDR